LEIAGKSVYVLTCPSPLQAAIDSDIIQFNRFGILGGNGQGMVVFKINTTLARHQLATHPSIMDKSLTRLMDEKYLSASQYLYELSGKMPIRKSKAHGKKVLCFTQF
jgi:hypothetical protein